MRTNDETMATSIDVARAAGVSQATVSRVLNEDRRVLPATRERVLEAIDRLGYRPNAIARGLVTSSTGLVGVVVSNITNPFYPELLEAIAARLAERRLKMVLHNGVDHEDEVVRRLLEQRVDGIVLTSSSLRSGVVAELTQRRVPFVLVNRTVDDAACDSVSGENAGGGALAAEHLLELGHRRIALIAGSPQASTSRDRVAGFRSALRRAGVPLPRELVANGDFRFEPAYAAARGLLSLDRPPSAIFCANDLMAFAALSAAHRAGVPVPDRLSLVGFDALPMSGWEPFELTTVRQPLPEMARAAVGLLAARIADPERPVQRLVLASSLIVRATTGPTSGR
jgi:LacI family transcriptional regulator